MERLLNLSETFKPLRVGRVFGIPLRLNWSWFVIFALHTWAVSSLRLPSVAPDYDAWQYWLTGLLMTAALLSSVFFHELAHSLMAKAEGVGISNITLHIFGGVAFLERESPSPAADFRIAIVGPAMSFLIGFACFIARHFVGYATDSALTFDAFGYVGTVNLALALFNLLPGFPLDGGRMLRAYFWRKKNDYRAATLAACHYGRNIALILMCVGIIFGIRNANATIILYGFFIGFFLLDAAMTSARQVRPSLPAQSIGALMAIAEPIRPDLLLSDLIAGLGNSSATRYPVAVEGRLHGIITLEQVKRIPPERWPQTPARDVMHAVDRSLFIEQRATLAEALAQFKTNGLEFLAVIDGEGYLVGTISPKELERLKG